MTRNDPVLLLRTVRHLRARQIGYRLLRAAQHRLRPPESVEGWTPPSYPGVRHGGPALIPPHVGGNTRANLVAGRFTFINQARPIGWLPDWNGGDFPGRLWEYNLHYFDWLWLMEAQEAHETALDWIARHRPTRGATGWEPYPTSLRLVNWCGVLFGRDRTATEADAATRDTLWRSIWTQAEWLARNLEYHLGGNHLLENAAALAVAGAWFAGAAADRWLEAAVCVLAREIPEQILPDGMHYERAPMYHLRVLHVMENLVRTGEPRLRALVEPRLPAMRRALVCCTHPDGEIALLNDSAIGIYHPPRELARMAGWEWPEPQAGAWALADAGYYGWRDEAGNYLICDAALVGPDDIPGHAHADIFTFELSLAGRRVVVDGGLHDYERGERRAWCRSTRAHNTVEIGGRDQCEMWAAFRVGRRGRPRDVAWQPRDDGFRLAAWHDGYHRLPGGPVHERVFEWSREEGLTIVDTVKAGRPVRAAARVHLHPALQVEPEGDVLRVTHEGTAVAAIHPPATSRVESCNHHPMFNTVQSARAVTVEATGDAIRQKWAIRPAPSAQVFNKDQCNRATAVPARH